MEKLNRFWQTSVIYEGKGRAEAVTHYLDPWYEILTRLVVRSVGYEIEDAVIEVMRAPEERETGLTRPDSLKGITAYRGVAGRVFQATARGRSGLEAGLILEGVKGLRQAQRPLWMREGTSPIPLAVLEREIRNSCIYFSIPESLQALSDPPHLKGQKRGGLLFSRYRYCFIEYQNQRQRVTSGLADSFHEMILHLELENNRVITVREEMPRVPHTICLLAKPTAERLAEKTVPHAAREWERALLGPDGCTHLADVAREAADSLGYWCRMRQLYDRRGEAARE